eukprot:CAMPEP_0185904228 /NCGR_PEP_ID=MMETSP0196C-20130402/3554_1 /TAXON_ID=2932 /ORGANISM="Alexandrium fundyense, Strain CCMP1719" /LENGTH=62 /DNA_ID=CAMNT_0028623495 /DNA_START=186 /DNA_END=370 /DNA_ORIENTATION=-
MTRLLRPCIMPLTLRKWTFGTTWLRKCPILVSFSAAPDRCVAESPLGRSALSQSGLSQNGYG